LKLNTLLSRAEVKKEWSGVTALCHNLPSCHAPERVKDAIIPFIVSPNARFFFLEKVGRRETNLKVPEFKLSHL
jgi:hypothetical protein